jgi:N-acetylglucosaminyldiphosphoundecaprenol N-acetyl-beta-D-mannosaminyltransferase
VIEPVWVWGVPSAPVTLEEAVEAVDALIERRRPSYFITANLHYLMLSNENPDLAAVNDGAAFILADGAPVVWAARRRPTPLPERVAGSDLIFHLCDLSARKGRRLFFLGAPEGVAEEAADKLRRRYPGIQIVGTECPPFRKPTEAEHDQLIDRIRAANPDVLFVAFGQPKGERWIFENLDRLAVPVCVQVGASLEFAAGRFARAPRWMQRTGLEWAFRLLQEPRRLFSRYARNAWFMGRMIVRDRIREPDSTRIAPTTATTAVEPPQRPG